MLDRKNPITMISPLPFRSTKLHTVRLRYYYGGVPRWNTE